MLPNQTGYSFLKYTLRYYNPIIISFYITHSIQQSHDSLSLVRLLEVIDIHLTYAVLYADNFDNNMTYSVEYGV